MHLYQMDFGMYFLEKVMDKAQKKNYLVEHRIHIYLIRGLKFIKKIKDM